VTFSAVKNTTKIAINILQGSVVAQSALDKLIINNFFATLVYFCQKI